MFFKKKTRSQKRSILDNKRQRLSDVKNVFWKNPVYILVIQTLVTMILVLFVIWAHARNLELFGDQTNLEETVFQPLDVLSSSDIARSLANLAQFREITWVEIQAYNSRTPTEDVGGLPVVAKPSVINSTIRTRHDILQYVVSPGDTVFSLADYFNVTISSIRLSNNLTTNALTVGETILIPPPGLNGIVYLVQPGDSLTVLTNSYHFSSAAMLNFNDLAEGQPLPVGELIFLPSANLASAQSVPDFVTQAVISSAQPGDGSIFNIDNRDCYGCVIVRAGDKIGTLGNTGWSTGPHLHIEIITHDGRRHNPWAFINQNRLLWPVDQKQRRVTQVFGGGHRGLDIGNREGTNILAIADGEIIHRGCLWANSSKQSTFGIIIDHGSYYSLSIHLQAPNNAKYEICSINRRSQYGSQSIDYSITE